MPYRIAANDPNVKTAQQFASRVGDTLINPSAEQMERYRA